MSVCTNELQKKVLMAEEAISTIGDKTSPKYQDALKAFATAWFVLKRSRDPQEFLSDSI